MGTNNIQYQADLQKIKDNSHLPHVSESKAMDPTKLNLVDPDGEKVKRDFIPKVFREDHSFVKPLEHAEMNESII